MVVPCRNEALTIASLLDALAAQTRAPDHTVIVDDASTDATAAIVRDWASRHPGFTVSVVQAGGRGAGPALNAGISASSADIIVRLDGHCRPRPDYIALSVETLGESAGVSGGIWEIEPGAPTRTARGIAAVLSHPLGSGGAVYRSGPGSGAVRAVDTVPFGTFRRALWEELGGFDETLRRNQDYDFNYRVRLTGRQVLLNPAIVSTYRARPTLRALARQYFAYGAWKIVMLRKFPASLRLRQFLPMTLLPLAGIALTASALTRSAWPLLWPAAYLALNAAGGLHAALKVSDLAAAPAAVGALLTLQLSWSAGAWWSLLGGRRAVR